MFIVWREQESSLATGSRHGEAGGWNWVTEVKKKLSRPFQAGEDVSSAR